MKGLVIAALACVMSVSAMAQLNLDKLLESHPNGATLKRLLAPASRPTRFTPTGKTKKDYLPLIAGEVDFWKHHLDERGAIIDPYEHAERQYSTPAFALAAALLVQEDNRSDLLELAARAMSFATAALANKTTADNHADFYIPMLMHARRILRTRVDPAVAAKWDEQFRAMVPEKVYRATKPSGNWNLVNVSGEHLRRKDGLVAPEHAEAQREYLDKCLDGQQQEMTNLGMYFEGTGPLAYDAFPRLWLEDALADGAITGERGERLGQWLAKGALSGLCILSPSGEWASGGRSAHHQWNEAENAEIAEINAVKWKQAGREDIAGMFKRAARLCLRSMYRWQRPSGEMWIVKNLADPARRHGFEGYSFHSQYNLLPMGMLAIAYERADDTIAEVPIPSESASYVFDFREDFHHVAAAAGGYYVLIDTSADPHYCSTGLQRVHRVGVELSPVTDTPGPVSGLGPGDSTARTAMSTGVEWQVSDGSWHRLGQFTLPTPPATTRVRRTTAPTEPHPPTVTKSAELKVIEEAAERVVFSIRYETQGPGARVVEETYTLSAAGVECAQKISGEKIAAARIAFPALVHDGARPALMNISGNWLTVTRRGALTRRQPQAKSPFITKPGGTARLEVLAPANMSLALAGGLTDSDPPVATHNGYVQRIVGLLPEGVTEARWRITLEAEGAK